jgi:transcriptional regulator with XRE-family HTH domain
MDVHVGSRIRLGRMTKGLSQTQLAQALGLPANQVEKYERGESRVDAASLVKVSSVLDVSIRYFFDELAADLAGFDIGRLVVAAGIAGDPSGQRPGSQEVLELLQAYSSIAGSAARRRVMDFIRSTISGDHDTGPASQTGM